tara:strand:- start:5108 stop:5761 length:654 start_codon:yes stop_codon:yes gene_type:complete
MKSIKLIKITEIDLNKTKIAKSTGKPYEVAQITFTRPQDEGGTKTFTEDFFHGTLQNDPFFKATADTLNTLQIGDEIGLVKEKEENDKWWTTTGFVPKEDVPAPKPAYTGGGGGNWKKGGGGGDTAGVKSGAAYKDAVALTIKYQETLDFDFIDATAEQLVIRSLALEERIRAGEFKGSGSTTPAVGIKKETPSVAQALPEVAKVEVVEIPTKQLPF